MSDKNSVNEQAAETQENAQTALTAEETAKDGANAENTEAVKGAKPKFRITKNTVLYFLVLNLGVFLIAFSLWIFQAPNNFALGGVGGISVVLAKVLEGPTHGILSYSVIYGLLNAILLIFGLIFLGKALTLKTIYCTVVLSLENILLNLIPTEHIFPLTGGDQLFLELVFAVLITGAGQAIVFNCRASSGGTDIIALIIKKYSKSNIGFALFVADILVACLAFWQFTTEIGLLSIIGVFAKSFVIDGVIENITKTKYVTIITEHPDMVSEIIVDYIHRGFTKMEAIGGYTGDPRTVIITVCRRAQAAHLKAKLHDEDPTSFVIITDANEILGKGFAERM